MQISTPPISSTSLCEPGEVDLDVVVDGDAERLRDRRGQALRALVVGRVDLRRWFGAGDRHPQVAGQAEQRGAAVALPAQHHDRVAAPADGVLGVADGAGVGIVGVDALAGVGADEQVVLGRHVVGRLLEHLLHALDPRDVVRCGPWPTPAAGLPAAPTSTARPRASAPGRAAESAPGMAGQATGGQARPTSGHPARGRRHRLTPCAGGRRRRRRGGG